MKTTFLIMLLLYCVQLFSQQENAKIPQEHGIGYNLSVPDRIIILPDALHEVSGLTPRDDGSLLCVMDEYEIAFIYDLYRNLVIRQLYYGSTGDYEDLVRLGKDLYFLRSDGVIVEINDYESGKFKRTAYLTQIPLRDNEGLCYDRKSNNLLVSHKEIPGKESGGKDKRYIFGFNLSTKALNKEPVLTLDMDDIKEFILDNDIKVPMKNKKKGEKKEPDIELRISALAINPMTGKLFMLSSADRLLIVSDMNGTIGSVVKLKNDLFAQPEGIAFMKNGDMYISNEGGEKPATLLKFSYNPVAGSGTDK